MQIQRILITFAAIDLEAIVSFYRQILGKNPDVYQSDRYAEFNLDHCCLGLFKPHPDHAQTFAPAATSPFSLCLQVPDLESAILVLTQAGATLDPLAKTIVSSHGQEIYAYDPLGNRIILYQANLTPVISGC